MLIAWPIIHHQQNESGRKMKNPFIQMAIQAAATMRMLPPGFLKQQRLQHRADRGKPASYYKPNGERECARRRRQIAKGMIKVSA